MPQNAKEVPAPPETDNAYRFRLYVAGDAANSLQAIANLNALCRKYLSSNYSIELVDVLQEPQRALNDGVLVTPTLVKVWPVPVRRIIGNLNDRSTVLRTLGLSLDALPPTKQPPAKAGGFK